MSFTLEGQSCDHAVFMFLGIEPVVNRSGRLVHGSCDHDPLERLLESKISSLRSHRAVNGGRRRQAAPFRIPTILRLTTETVQSAALALEGVDDVKRRDSLTLGVLSVGDGITDDTLEERLENTAGLLVDHCMLVRHCLGDRQARGQMTYWPRYA